MGSVLELQKQEFWTKLAGYLKIKFEETGGGGRDVEGEGVEAEMEKRGGGKAGFIEREEIIDMMTWGVL